MEGARSGTWRHVAAAVVHDGLQRGAPRQRGHVAEQLALARLLLLLLLLRLLRAAVQRILMHMRLLL